MIKRDRVVVLLGAGFICLCVFIFAGYLSGQTVSHMEVVKILSNAAEKQKAVSIDVLVLDNDSRSFTVFPVSNYENRLFRCLAFSQGVYVNDLPLYDFHILEEPGTSVQPFLPAVLKRKGYMRFGLNRIIGITELPESPLYERIEFIRGELARIGRELALNARNGLPLQITFKDGRQIRGLIDAADPAYIQALLYAGKNDKGVDALYTEFISRFNSEVPVAVPVDASDASFQREINRYGNKPFSDRPGLFTNTYTWMGRSDIGLRGSLEAMASQLDHIQYSSLFSVRILGMKGEIHDLTLGDVSEIVSVERIPDETIVRNSRQYYEHFEGVCGKLRHVWNEDPSQTVYVEFSDRPFFAGKLVEYVPPYHNSSIYHLVLANEQGDFVIIRSPFFVKSLYFDKELNVVEREEIEGKMAVLRRSVEPANPLVIDEGTELPLKVRSGEKFTRHTTLKIAAVKHIGPENTDAYAVHPLYDANKSDMFVEINFTLTNPNLQGNQLTVYYDEFSLYSSGRFYPMHCFFDAQRNITDAISIDYAERIFTVVFKVPRLPDDAYLRYSDMEPVKIIFKK
ncbi:MAG: hypothetical protein C4541_13565 [Candidatus Auribacter fodinae]|jgi:hypothetical protein|uniref:Uncharacterized protein n=1 Tax=Candidatus Auribacter fodinae TaxID=2093366 RepID=A0A3A4QVA8_9BACT|nr:MAG: hypothetical protein C4541_13565 [Candidatus Auribacter fodinae]